MPPTNFMRVKGHQPAYQLSLIHGAYVYVCLFLMRDSLRNDDMGSMSASTLTVDQCQEHAKQCRAMARREANPETKKRLDDLAAQWEQLCEELTELHLQGRKR